MTYRFDDQLPKPCIHPLVTPAGRVLSGFEPSDHRWHRGLWFTIKFVNGDNFWEEDPPFGTQRSIREPSVTDVTPTGCTIRHALAWQAPDKQAVLQEARAIAVSRRGGEGDSARLAITWTSVLTAAVDVTLDRTPFTTWGGYGGLAFRAARELHNVRFTDPDGSHPEAVSGDSHRWLALDGRLDGGVDCLAGLAFFDHPDNPRSPSPFYAKSANGFTYSNPTFLFHEPMKLSAGEQLALTYRVLVKDGRWEMDELTAESERFNNEDIAAASETSEASS